MTWVKLLFLPEPPFLFHFALLILCHPSWSKSHDLCSIALTWESLWAGLFSVTVSVGDWLWTQSVNWLAGRSELLAGRDHVPHLHVSSLYGHWHHMTCTRWSPIIGFSVSISCYVFLFMLIVDFVQVHSQSCPNPYLISGQWRKAQYILIFHLMLFTDFYIPIPILQILLPSPHSSQISADFHIAHPTVETKSGSSFVALNWVESVWGLVNSVAPSSLVKRIWAFGVAGFHHTPYFILVLGGSA